MSGGYATPRVDARPWTHEDVDVMYDVYRRWEVARWLGAPPKAAESVDEMHERVDRWGAICAEPGPFGAWAVVPRDLGTPVGTVLLLPLDRGAGGLPGEVEIGWHLHPDSWGRGLATEAARPLLARGFALGLAEIWAVTDPMNRRSAHVCEKLGMRLLGTTDRWYHELSLMFWIGARDGQQPTISPDAPASN
jgi:RimJ/RimL family protein N-acetyltransferase